MITQFFIQMIAGVVSGIFSVIPQWGVSTDQVTSINNSLVGFASINGWFPEQLVFIAMAIVVGTRLFFLGWAGVLFLYRLIPFNG